MHGSARQRQLRLEAGGERAPPSRAPRTRAAHPIRVTATHRLCFKHAVMNVCVMLCLGSFMFCVCSCLHIAFITSTTLRRLPWTIDSSWRHPAPGSRKSLLSRAPAHRVHPIRITIISRLGFKHVVIYVWVMLGFWRFRVVSFVSLVTRPNSDHKQISRAISISKPWVLRAPFFTGNTVRLSKGCAC